MGGERRLEVNRIIEQIEKGETTLSEPQTASLSTDKVMPSDLLSPPFFCIKQNAVVKAQRVCHSAYHNNLRPWGFDGAPAGDIPSRVLREENSKRQTCLVSKRAQVMDGPLPCTHETSTSDLTATNYELMIRKCNQSALEQFTILSQVYGSQQIAASPEQKRLRQSHETCVTEAKIATLSSFSQSL